jgi:hypothetical protein
MFREPGVGMLTMVLAVVSTITVGQEMAPRLDRPAAVPLDFLSWIDRDESWLMTELADAGFDADVEIGKGVVEVSSVAALRSVNRMRTFAFLAAESLRPPFFDLIVTDGSQTVRCTTVFPKEVVPGIGPMDFGKQRFEVASIDPDFVDPCRVDPKATGDYQGLDRNTFRERYFDRSGNLRAEFRGLNSNPNFIAEAIEHGFLVRSGALAGLLRLEEE